MITEELHPIETSVHTVSTRVRCLERLIEHERTNVAQVTKIKRELKTAHRSLEKFQVENCRGLGDEVEALVRDATRHAWQSYRGMVSLEERLRDVQSGEMAPPVQQWGNDEAKSDGTMRDAKRPQERQGVYIPTGARMFSTGVARPKRKLHTPLNNRRQIRERVETIEDVYTGYGGLPVKPSNTQTHSPSTAYHALEDINSSAFPQPRISVKLRLQHEEASQKLTLDAPDQIRRGSCDGLTLTNMIMHGIQDHRFVLPCFHHIKHHEVRALKNWLTEKKYVKRSGGISRMERVLHCIELLQTGCRYESLAVTFSRSPRDIKESCHQVMAGLLRLHSDTVGDVDEATSQVGEMYMPLWGLWTKYNTTAKGRAAVYYEFDAAKVAKVLGALNVYIGRWRSQGRFAMDGPVFRWGGVFVVELAAGTKTGGKGKETAWCIPEVPLLEEPEVPSGTLEDG